MNSIKQTIKGALTGLALLALSNCASTKKDFITETNYKRPSVYYQTSNNLKGAELRQVTNRDSKYSLERAVINGNDLYIEKNKNKLPDELDILFIRYEDHSKIVDDKKRETKITSETFFIPKQVMVEDESAEKKTPPKLKKATRDQLVTEGKYGIKTQTSNYDTREIQTGIINETQDNTKFKIKTIVIDNKEWYVPHVEEAKMNDVHALNFYMIPVDETKKEIDSQRRITLINERDGIFRPVEISRKDYEARKKDEKKEIGQTSAIK